MKIREQIHIWSIRSQATDKIDTMSLGMITNNKIAGIVPTVFTQLDADKFIKYNVTSRITAKEFLTGLLTKTSAWCFLRNNKGNSFSRRVYDRCFKSSYRS